MPYVRLDTAKTTTGTSNAYQWYGGIAHMSVANIGSSGAVNLQYSPASSTGPFGDVAEITASSTDDAINVQLGPGGWIRSNITVASSTGMDTYIN